MLRRDPARVIEAILREIPEEGYDTLRKILTANMEIARHSLPSSWPHTWACLPTLLMQHLGFPDTPWKIRVSVIIMGKNVESPETADEATS